jgi:hypothetical protein
MNRRARHERADAVFSLLLVRMIIMRAVMDSHHLDPLVLEFELIRLRRDLQRILSERGAGKKKEDYG